MNFKRTTILLILITALALFLRVHGINYYSYGDEAYHVYNSLGLGSGHIPRSFHRIALFLFYSIFYLVGWVLGIFTTPRAFIGAYFSHQHVFYLSGRLFEALMGTAAVPLLYLLGKKMFSRKTGLAAAFFLAVAPVPVEVSQIARGQALAITLAIGAMYFSYRSIREDRAVLYLLSGFALGAAASIRPYFLVILLPVVCYLWLRSGGPAAAEQPRRAVDRLLPLIGHRGLWLVLISFVAMFILSYPGIVLNYRTYLTANLGNISLGEEKFYLGSDQTNPWKYYLLDGFPSALSWPLYLVFIAGSVRAVVRKNREGIILASTCLIYFLGLGRGIIAAPRYLSPIIPACLLLAADFVLQLFLRGGLSGRWRNYLSAGIILLLSIPAGGSVVESNRRNRMKSTKNLAEEWIFENIPCGSRIAVERMGYTGPDLKLTPVLDYWIYNLSEEELKDLLEERLSQGQPSEALKHFIRNPPDKKYYTTTISVREVIDVGRLQDEKYEFIVTSSSAAGIYRDPQVQQRYPEHYRSRLEFYRWLDEQGEQLQVFLPDQDTPGEELRIYRVQPSP